MFRIKKNVFFDLVAGGYSQYSPVSFADVSLVYLHAILILWFNIQFYRFVFYRIIDRSGQRDDV